MKAPSPIVNQTKMADTSRTSGDCGQGMVIFMSKWLQGRFQPTTSYPDADTMLAGSMSAHSASANGSPKVENCVMLSSVERRILLEDIARIGLALGRELDPDSSFSSQEARLPVSQSDGADTNAATPLERIRLLDTLWPQIASAVGAIVCHPESAVYSETITRPVVQSRGGVTVANVLARTPRGRAAWQHLREKPWIESPFISDFRPSSTLETRGNRLAVTLLLRLEQEANALSALAEFCGEDGVAMQSRSVAEGARRWRMGTFLHSLPPLSARETASIANSENTLHGSLLYRALFAYWRQLRLPLRWDWAGSPLLHLPALEAWHLYEIWCFFQVVRALQETGWRALEGNAVRWEADGLRLALATGQTSRIRFSCNTAGEHQVCIASHADKESGGTRPTGREATLELFYQPLFPSANQHHPQDAEQTPQSYRSVREEARCVSLSHAMQPDIALVWQGRLLLLDPKFRTYAERGAEQDDVNKMHTYRDAIVRDGRRVVEGAWCLFPGQNGSEERIVAYPTSTPERPFGTAGVGALRLRPGSHHRPLAGLLQTWL